MKLYQRHHIDIGWRDLAFAIASLFRAGDGQAARQIASHWPSDRTTVPCLSVRTAFDGLLTVMNITPGDEIIMSGVNIAGMAEIATAHGLTIRSLDIDRETLAPSHDDVAASLSDRTRLILIAHLFGGRVDLAPFARLRPEQALLVEDCAQAWTPDFRCSSEADVSLFSFGPIKTITALGGAVAILKSPELAATLTAHLASYPANGRGWFARRIAKFAALKVASQPVIYGMIYRAFRLLGLNFEQKMGALARGFGQGELLLKIRRQPPDALLRLLARRLMKPSDVAARRQCAEDVVSEVEPAWRVGGKALAPSHWVTPIMVENPSALCDALRARGFDATRGTTSIRAIGAEKGFATHADQMLNGIVYLPSPAFLPSDRRAELRDLLVRAGSNQHGLVPNQPRGQPGSHPS